MKSVPTEVKQERQITQNIIQKNLAEKSPIKTPDSQ